MSNWLNTCESVRAQPRLWVETLWLVESREPLVLTRTIDLHTGLNIVWAKESASNDASGLASAGHGVGKTSLCLLLRHVLGDDAPSIVTLRSKAAGSFPKGGVAAKVHVDGTIWLVFRPYGLYSHSMAAQCDALDQLLSGTSPSDFDGYGRALEQFSIGRLAARSLPGTNQPLEWRHLLAWCSREQRTRFDGFYHWREGEGLGFKRSRRDPPLLVGSVLGLVDQELDRLLRDIESRQKQVEQCKERISELERTPVFALAHADRQLRLRVRAEEDEPVFTTTVGESVESRVQAALQTAELDERRWEREVEQAEDVLAEEQVHLKKLTKVCKLAELEAGKKAELRRLRVRVATSESARTFLKQSWDELQVQYTQRTQGGDTAELVEARRQLQEFEAALYSLRATEVSRRSEQSSRVDAIKALTAAVSTKFLGASGHARFVPGHEVRPFEVARGGEAFQVLEVLLGDIVCLLDSAVSEFSHHPGFLVHDCPREADMSEHLYRNFFLAAAEAAEQLGKDGAVPFQFIVTTTSAPPEELGGAPYVVLELAPGADEALLFKRQLAPELTGFDLA